MCTRKRRLMLDVGYFHMDKKIANMLSPLDVVPEPTFEFIELEEAPLSYRFTRFLMMLAQGITTRVSNKWAKSKRYLGCAINDTKGPESERQGLFGGVCQTAPL